MSCIMDANVLRAISRYLCIGIALFSCFKSFAGPFELLNPYYDSHDIIVLDVLLNRRKNYITYIMDKAKNIFIIKQAKANDPASPIGPLTSVLEALAVYIAESNSIPANLVRIIPPGCAIPGKQQIERPATLHTLVPGTKGILMSNCPFLQQRFGARIPENKLGLTYKVIHHMSRHKDLAKIVALDTFIGVDDRWGKNFFYDEPSDTFWAIDFGRSFDKNLCKLACNFINSLLKDESCKPSSEELHGLILYRDTLKGLVKRHPPPELHKKLDQFLLQAGIKPKSSLFNDMVASRIDFYKIQIIQNYASAQELVVLLDEFIACNKKIAK